MAGTSGPSNCHHLQPGVHAFRPCALVFSDGGIPAETTEMNGRDGTTRMTISFRAWVHTLAAELKTPLPKDREHLEEASEVYQFVIASRLLWRVWMLDEYEHYWIEV